MPNRRVGQADFGPDRVFIGGIGSNGLRYAAPNSTSQHPATHAMAITFSSIRVRLAALIGGVSLLWASATALYFDRAASASMGEASAQTLHTLSQSLSLAFATNLAERQKSIDVLSTLPVLTRGELGHLEARHALAQTKATYKHYAWLGTVDASGIVQAASGGLLEGVSVKQRPWFIQAHQGSYTGDVHEALLLAKALKAADAREPLRFVDFAAPIHDAQGQLKGVIGAHANWDWAKEVIAKALPQDAAAKRIEVFVVNQAGKVIYPFAQPGALTVPDALLKQDTEVVLAWPDQQRYLSSSQAVKADIATPLGWRIVVRQPLETALAPVSAMHRRLALLGAVGVLFVTASAFLFSARFSRPIERLARAARRLANGQEHVQFQAGSQVAELRTLADSLSEMTSRLLDQQHALQEANATLEHKVAQRTQELAELYDQAPVGYHTVDANGVISQINATELHLLGYERDEVVGKVSALTLFAPHFQPTAQARLASMLRGEPLQSQDAEMRRKDGQPVHVRLSSTPILGRDGTLIGARTAVMDISDMKALEASLDEQQAINQAIIHSSPNGIILYKADGQCVLANESAARMIGATAEAMLQQNFMQLQSWKDTGLLECALQAVDGTPTQKMVSFTSSFGKYLDCLVSFTPLDSRGERLVLLIGRDVSELVRANRELDKLARHDALTGLHNRLSANERLRQEFQRSKRSHAPFSVLLLDVDHFKKVNDNHGHEAGDQVLKHVGQQIKDAVRSTDYVARFGGEEFLVILPDTVAADAALVAEKVRAAVANSVQPAVGHITVSIGLAQMNAAMEGEAHLVRLADQALYAAKGTGRNRVEVWAEAS